MAIALRGISANPFVHRSGSIAPRLDENRCDFGYKVFLGIHRFSLL
jgi:hypothetical protein